MLNNTDGDPDTRLVSAWSSSATYPSHLKVGSRSWLRGRRVCNRCDAAGGAGEKRKKGFCADLKKPTALGLRRRRWRLHCRAVRGFFSGRVWLRWCPGVSFRGRGSPTPVVFGPVRAKPGLMTIRLLARRRPLTLRSRKNSGRAWKGPLFFPGFYWGGCSHRISGFHGPLPLPPAAANGAGHWGRLVEGGAEFRAKGCCVLLVENSRLFRFLSLGVGPRK